MKGHHKRSRAGPLSRSASSAHRDGDDSRKRRWHWYARACSLPSLGNLSDLSLHKRLRPRGYLISTRDWKDKETARNSKRRRRNRNRAKEKQATMLANAAAAAAASTTAVLKPARLGKSRRDKERKRKAAAAAAQEKDSKVPQAAPQLKPRGSPSRKEGRKIWPKSPISPQTSTDYL